MGRTRTAVAGVGAIETGCDDGLSIKHTLKGRY
jgi:hypothetical protein